MTVIVIRFILLPYPLVFIFVQLLPRFFLAPKQEFMSIVLALILIFILFLIGSALVVLVIGPLILLQPPKRVKEWYIQITNLLEPRDAGLPQENVTLATSDGVLLKGWLVRQPFKQEGDINDKVRGTIIFLHGVGDCRIAGVQHSRLLYDHGYNVFLYDSRQHGESGGAFCTYGFYEKHDVSTVIDYLYKRDDIVVGKIGLFGTSMGAAVAIQAAALDDRISAVISEASFTDLRTISVDYQKRIIKLPWHFLRNIALNRAQKVARFKAREVSPLEDLQKVKIPLCFIHGREDSFISYEYSKTLYHHAHQPKELLIIPGADHNDIWEVGGTVYTERILTFFQKYLA